MTTEEKLKEIKRSFRMYMDGARAQSMREKGLDYHINWGLSIGHIKEMASEYGTDYELAIMLWKENIRECKILATLLMPADSFRSDLAMLWIEQLPNQEIAEYLCANVLQHTSYAMQLGLQLLAEQAALPRLCGYNILSGLFMQGTEPAERDINEYLDQAISVINDSNEPISLRKAAMSSINHFADINGEYALLISKTGII